MTKHVVFIHGLWLHATSWNPGSIASATAGYDPIAPGWPGEPDTVEEARENPDAVANIGIDDVTDHYADIIDGLDEPAHPHRPLLRRAVRREAPRARASVPRPSPSTPPRSRESCRCRWPSCAPAFPRWATRPTCTVGVADREGVPVRLRQRPVSEEESDELFDEWTIPSPARPLFQAAAANFVMHSQAKVNTDNASRGPLLLISGLADHTVPDVVTRSTLKQYRDSTAVTELQQFEGRGHSLTIDSGWRDVADATLEWLKANGLS